MKNINLNLFQEYFKEKNLSSDKNDNQHPTFKINFPKKNEENFASNVKLENPLEEEEHYDTHERQQIINYFSHNEKPLPVEEISYLDDIEIADLETVAKVDQLNSNIQNYIQLKNHKYSLNELLEDKIKQTDEFLNNSVYKNNKTFFSQSQLLNWTSFKKFSKIIGKNKNIKQYPLYTRLKLLEELNKIEKKSKFYAAISTLIVAPILSYQITNYIFSTFSKDIRNKQLFYKRRLLKIPFILTFSFYFMFKNIFLIYYLRQPLINLNNIYCDTYQKEHNNKQIKKVRLKILNRKKLIQNEEEYNKCIVGLYGEESTINTSNREKRSFKLPFYLFHYKRILYSLYFSKMQVSEIDSFMSFLADSQNKFKFEYFKIILFNSYFEDKTKNEFKYSLHSYKLVNVIKKSFNYGKKGRFEMKLFSSNRNSKNKVNNKFNLYLKDLLEDSGINNDIKKQIVFEMYLLDVLRHLQVKDTNKQIIRYYQCEVCLKYLKHFKIKALVNNIDNFNNLITDEKEMRKFVKFLNNKNIKVPKEYITHEEYALIYYKLANISHSNISTVLFTESLLCLFTQLYILKYFKIL